MREQCLLEKATNKVAFLVAAAAAGIDIPCHRFVDIELPGF